MIDGVITGHEPAFDFPRRAQLPEHPYLLATTPRSGSSWFGHLLWETGCLGAPLEYLNFTPGSPLGHMRDDPPAQRRHWEHTITTRTAPNGVFGIKAFPLQFEELGTLNPQLLNGAVRFLLARGPHTRVVHLVRRDRTAHAISYARASLSGRWRAAQEGEGQTEPPFSRLAVDNAMKIIDRLENTWAAMFRDLRIEPLRLVYEDVRGDPEGALKAVADYLSVRIDPEARVAVPEISRQKQEGARLWAEAYAAGEEGATPSPSA
ncbi:Stf0 family sulfotransferase [Alteriqipengyuania sp.]|uniref:Stf0 family sulfotransferase n=1 Tax=Alteriqipengyuania sp. TaxID=2800692 RepID=UPI0035197DCA